jgi:hypothetical protein
MGSIQYASADHSLGGQGIFKDETTVSIKDSIDSKYMIHLQVVVRDAQGQLVSVSERMHGSYIPHEITDYLFDNIMGEKEIYNIDGVKYEKVRHTPIHDVQTFDWDTSFQDILSTWSIMHCTDFTTIGHGSNDCIPIFQTVAPNTILAEDDVFTLHWTILREF